MTILQVYIEKRFFFAWNEIILIRTIPGIIFPLCRTEFVFFCYSFNIMSVKSWPRFFLHGHDFTVKYADLLVKVERKIHAYSHELTDRTNQRCILYGKRIFNIQPWFEEKNGNYNKKLFLFNILDCATGWWYVHEMIKFYKEKLSYR